MFGSLNPVSNRLGWLFEELLPSWSAADRAEYPAVNLWEDESKFMLEAELPGLRRENLEITTQGRQLRIGGEHVPGAKEGWTCHRQERPYGKFSRLIEFPVMIDEEKVQAIFTNGVLSVTLPKAQSALPRKIEVKGIETK